MASTSETKRNKGPIIDPALCRCCRNIKKCRLLTTEYEWMGDNEIYSDILLDCFGLVLSHLDGEDQERGVCATCVTRLRDANAFKTQVLHAEELFWEAKARLLEGSVEIKLEPSLNSDCEDIPDDGSTPAVSSPTLEYTTEQTDDTIVKESKLNNLASIASCKPKIRKKIITTKKDGSKKKLLKDIKKTKRKLVKRDKILPKRESKLEKIDSQQTELDTEQMAYENTVTIVQSSFVCPFLTRVSVYYCYYCKDQFTDPTELRDHTANQHDPKSFVSMLENKKIPKIDITRIDCRLCPKKIDSLNELRQHLLCCHAKKTHEIANEFLSFKLTLNDLRCLECNETFPYFDKLKRHMNKHFGKYVCDICGACFFEQTSLGTHIRAHSKKEIDFPCGICSKTLKSKYSRQVHIATIHEKKPTVNCYKCEEVFMSHALRNKHLIEVHADKRTFPCQHCDKVYKLRKTLVEHIRRNHSKVYKHECNVCGQKFFLPSRLREHMSAHTAAAAADAYPRNLITQNHSRASASERRLRCNQCDASFLQTAALRNHTKSHHQQCVNPFNDERLSSVT